MEFALPLRGGTACRVLEASPSKGIRGPLIVTLVRLAELSYITYHAHQTHFLFAHIIAEVCDVLALVRIALGLSRRVTPVVPGAPQHR